MESNATHTLISYAEDRARLLAEIVASLGADDRFVAAWLTGSFGRCEEDAISDLDLTVVVADADARKLCARLRQVGSGTTDGRLALVSQFGRPTVIHENHHNAPEGGSFTFVLYAETALMVDWTLVPQSHAVRPRQSRLLFDKVGIADQPSVIPESPEQRIERASERVAFFWMMTAVAAKYLVRGDSVRFHTLLDVLHSILGEVRGLVSGEVVRYHRGSLVEWAVTPADQATAVRQACGQMLELMAEVKYLDGSVLSPPMPLIERLLGLAEGSQVHGVRHIEGSPSHDSHS